MNSSINIELFSCSGGMAEGFRRAGIEFDFVFDYDDDACDSYEQNLKHRPVRMDVRDLVRMAKGGWRPGAVGLLVADPPCTPWSRAGKRLGTEDERDMLEETAELIVLLRPRAYLIGNVPGLQDSTSWHVVQRVIGGLRKHGYCVADYATLDAADYGVPQHRIRPFWYGHLDGPCVRWPVPSHGDPSHPALPGLALKPWVTCRAALGHLPIEDLGRPVRLKRKAADGVPVPLKWAAGGRVQGEVTENAGHAPYDLDAPASTVCAKDYGSAGVLRIRNTNEGHPTVQPDGLAPTIRGGGDGHSAPEILLEVAEPRKNHPASRLDAPSHVIKCNGGRASMASSTLRLDDPVAERSADPRRAPENGEEPCRAVTTQAGANHLLEWPWDRPATTVHEDPRLAPPDHHTESFLSPLEAKGQKKKRPPSTSGPQSSRVTSPDALAPTVQSREDRIGTGAVTLDWPWSRPSTTVCAGIDKIAAAGEHSGHLGPNAVVLSERAAAILQGFPESWVFSGATKKARWAQIGMAMPPPLAEAVARAIKAAMDAPRAEVQTA